MKKPLVSLTLSLSLGIYIAHKINIPFGLAYCTAWIILGLIILFFKKGRIYDILFLCLFFSLGIIFLNNARILPKNHLIKIVSHKNNNLYTISGFINSQPMLKSGRISFILDAQEIGWENPQQKCRGSILVYARDKRNFKLGEGLIITGRLFRPYKFGDSQSQNYRDYLYHQGIFFILYARGIRIIATSKIRYALKRIAFDLKNKMERRITRYVAGVPASILEAMILGERRNIPPLVNSNMIKSGTVHILVVSGFNTGIVAFIIIEFLKLIRIPKKGRFYIALPLLILYCVITQASPPVVRATTMTIVFLFAYLVRREPDIYNSLSIAALFILSLNPLQLFDIGFQLSFLSVFSIAYLYPKIKLFLGVDRVKIKYIRFIIEECIVSLSAWLGTMGLLAYYFKIISPVTVLANIFIVPIAALITLCGFSLIIVGSACPLLAPFFAYSSELAVVLLLNINRLFIKIPGAYFFIP